MNINQREKIVNLLKSKGEMTQAELAHAIYNDDEHYRNISNVLKDLMQKNVISRTTTSPYKYFLAINSTLTDEKGKSMTIKEAIQYYKENIEKFWKEESYKWEAVKWFQEKWNIDADDFAGMLEEALSKADNLLNGGQYHPNKMICRIAKFDPAKIREMFLLLFDEDLSLEERIKQFRDGCEAVFQRYRKEASTDGKEKNHYQDLRAITVYLTFNNPIKYFLFKDTMYRKFRDLVGYTETSKIENKDVKKYENYVGLCEKLISEINKDSELQDMQREKLTQDEKYYSDSEFHILAQTIIYVCSGVNDSVTAKGALKAAHEQVNLMDINEKMESNINLSKNTILYGPPGTGKTYNTVIYAVAIIEKRSIKEVEEETVANYEAVKARYDKYKEAGQIAFTTFHQSYGYEEFIEGIKPRLTEDDLDSDLDYSVESGVFKAFCEKASTPKQSESTNYGLNKSPTVWKVSLAGTYDNPVREECLKNNHIRVGWDSYGPDITDDMDYNRGGKFVLNAFMNSMKIGDIVLSCYSASTIDAIGVVTGEYEWDESFDEYKRIRKVNWLVKGINEDIVELNGGTTMTLSTVYKMKVTVGDVLKLLEKFKGNGEQSSTIPNDDNYVFIIDEINRGNISKIFGELITLIEDNKRLGAKEELTVKLPYSPNKPFGVPQNVYILGTMNTADRSIALMDTALRRRFEFVEIMPEPQVLRELGADYVKTDGQDLDVAKMLETINRRIEYLYDREHTIGHAFFTALSNNNTIECLAGIFKNKVIPLLQEYFFEDYEKIQLVLGDNDKSKECYKFVKDTKVNENDIFKKSPQLDLHEKTYEINEEAFICIESYIEIYEERKAEE